MYKVFGRDPALWLALVAGLVQMVSAFVLPLSGTQQGVVNALAVAVVGVGTAYSVARDRLVPAILGAVQAVLSLGLAFGLSMGAEQQSVLMAFTAGVVGMFVRTQVTAAVSEDEVRIGAHER